MSKRLCISAVAICLLHFGCAAPHRPDRNRPPTSSAPSAAAPAVLARLDPLITGLSAEDPLARAAPQQELERWCMEASRPGAETERIALCTAIIARLDARTPLEARLWLMRALQQIGAAESVPPLTKALSDNEPLVREAARRALRADVSAPPPPAISELIKHLQSSDLRAQSDAADALLRAAENQMRAARNDHAAHAYRALHAHAPHERFALAALCGLACIDARHALPELARLVAGKGSDASHRGRLIAIRIMQQMPEPAATRQLRDLMPHLDEPLLVAVIEALAERGGPDARLAVLTHLNAPQPAVAHAVIRAMEKLGAAPDVPTLAARAGELDHAGRDALVEALSRIRGAEASQVMLTLLADPDTTPPACIVLIRALRARVFPTANAALLAATRDPRAGVPAAAFEALTEDWPAERADELVAAMLASPDETARSAAENAVAEVCRRIPGDEDARSAPVLAVVPDASNANRAALVRVLGRLRGPAALSAIRAALHGDAAPVRDAAVRALAAWPDAVVLADLKAIVRENRSPAERMLGLRGAVRLAKQAPVSPHATLLDQFRELWDLATEDSERKLILGAIGENGDAEALDFALAACAQPALLNEAAAAVASIARRLAAREPRRAAAALDQLATRPVNDAAAGLVKNAREFITRHDGFIGEWMLAGPFKLDGADYRALFEHSFDPEAFGQPGAWQFTGAGQPPAGWKPLSAAPTSDNPWIFDLLSLSTAPNQCVYVGTFIWAESETPARLQIGSDDGVRAWLNDQLVHSNMAGRPVKIDEDIVPVNLRAGWNCLLLKITQYSGGWGFVCAVRDPTGAPLPGLTFAPFRNIEDTTGAAATRGK